MARAPRQVRAADHMEGMRCCGSRPGQGLDPRSASFWLWDLRQSSQPLCAAVCSSVGVMVEMELAGGRDAACGGSCAGFTAEEPGAQRSGASGAPSMAPSSCLLQSHAGTLPLGPMGGQFRGGFQALGEEARPEAAWAVGVGNVRVASRRDPLESDIKSSSYTEGCPPPPRGRPRRPAVTMRGTHTHTHLHAHALSPPADSQHQRRWKLADAWAGPQESLNPSPTTAASGDPESSPQPSGPPSATKVSDSSHEAWGSNPATYLLCDLGQVT